jgi:2-oxo-4-hydroxy-4-carboxy-5-ureidoimidazoline decarboxylase
MPTLAEINAYSPRQFSAAFGAVYEHSPWIAERAYARAPFASAIDLHLALYAVMYGAEPAEQRALLRAHPELAGRAAQAGSLSPDSAREQHAAGLGLLTPTQASELADLNRQYRERFGFPFIIAARLNNTASIIGTLRARLHNDPAQEMHNALAQVGEIARLRLTDLLSG